MHPGTPSGARRRARGEPPAGPGSGMDAGRARSRRGADASGTFPAPRASPAGSKSSGCLGKALEREGGEPASSGWADRSLLNSAPAASPVAARSLLPFHLPSPFLCRVGAGWFWDPERVYVRASPEGNRAQSGR